MSSIRTDYHKQMGREAAKRCIAINGLREHCDFYCPLNLRGDKAGKKNAAEFKDGWEEIWVIRKSALLKLSPDERSAVGAE